MIPFETARVPAFDITIKKATESDRRMLLALKQEPALGVGADVVYVYSLPSLVIPYPNCSGNVAYIGEAGRPSEPTGKRFSQHICTEEFKGGDTGTNFTLSRYYWLGHPLNLKIYCLGTINDSRRRKDTEMALFQQHLKRYGALPIAQGASGERYTVDSITGMAIRDVLSDLLEASSART